VATGLDYPALDGESDGSRTDADPDVEAVGIRRRRRGRLAVDRRRRAMPVSVSLWRRILTALVVAIVVVVVFGIVVVLVAGRPPRTLTIAAGAPGGAYHRFAERLADALERRGFALTILETDGSVDNVAAIQAGHADIGLVQSGTEQVADVSGMTAIAELFYEPIWIWYRTDALPVLDELMDLAGRRVGVGVEGSGTYAIANDLLDLGGVAGVERVQVDADEVEQSLEDGSLDAAFVVAAADAPIISSLADAPGLGIHSYRQADAYARHLPFLTAIPIARGVLDLEHDVPPADGELLAARATLVGEPGMHPDAARLLVTLLPELLDYPLVGEPAAFPSLTRTRFEVNGDAAQYLAEGPTPLEQVLPFEIASPLSRYYVLILPLLVLFYPAWRILKGLWDWWMSRRIISWYPRIHAIERGLPESTLPQLEAQRDFLNAVVAHVSSRVRVTAGYLAAYYDLRINIAFVLRQVERRIEELRAAAEGREPAIADDGADVALGEARRPDPGAPARPLPDPRAFSDEEMGIDDDLREMRSG
jgi:TRAP transporter TAXI family solute receptor